MKVNVSNFVYTVYVEDNQEPTSRGPPMSEPVPQQEKQRIQPKRLAIKAKVPPAVFTMGKPVGIEGTLSLPHKHTHMVKNIHRLIYICKCTCPLRKWGPLISPVEACNTQEDVSIRGESFQAEGIDAGFFTSEEVFRKLHVIRNNPRWLPVILLMVDCVLINWRWTANTACCLNTEERRKGERRRGVDILTWALAYLE